jgi:hypothetical protein
LIEMARKKSSRPRFYFFKNHASDLGWAKPATVRAVKLGKSSCPAALRHSG